MTAHCNDWYKHSDNLNSRWRELLDSFSPGNSQPEPHPVEALRPVSILPASSAGRDPDTPANLESTSQTQLRHRSSQLDSFGEGTTMATRDELAEQVFLAVQALKPAERSSVLDEMCEGDAELRDLVEDKLAEEEEMGSFLEHPPLDFMQRTVTDPALANGKTADEAWTQGGRLTVGQVLNDRFVIVRFIAKGGMGEVYEAEDILLRGPHIALKTILPESAADPGLQHRFEQEVLSAREVTHPNLCPIYGIERCSEPAPGFLFLTMKLLPGETLAARLRRSDPVQKEEGLAIVRQMADGLAAIAAAGIVHRDIKPNNVMLDGTRSDVRVWITDFGLARALEAESTVSGPRTVVAGTPGYIAPELYEGHPPSQSSDLFAFGVVLHQVFAGEKPTAREDGSCVVSSGRLSASGAPSICIELLTGCLDRDPKRRCEAFEKALEALGLKRREKRTFTRRQFAGMAAAAACSFGVAGWVERERLYDAWHPLPAKRFVALLNWPKTSDGRIVPMLTGVLSAIKSELARAEAFDRNLFVVSPEDVDKSLAGTAHLREVCDPLGANLALAASGVPGAKHFELTLRVLNPITSQPLREAKLVCALADITSLPGKAVQAAARLLNVSSYLQERWRTQPGTGSTDAFTAFQQAETLRKQPNDTGLDAAIEKYKDAVDLDPHYAMAYAKLAEAYSRVYEVGREPGAIELARGNSERALALDPGIVEGHLAMASVLEATGNEQRALDEIVNVLQRDPSNPRALRWQAQIYTRLNRWDDAEKAFQYALKERPNSWVTYNNFGIALHAEGKFRQAIQAFRAASIAAPRSAMALGNLGGEYLQTGEFLEAEEASKKSFALEPNDLAAANIAQALRCQNKSEEALPFARKAVELNPAEDTNWLELGDCYSSLGNHKSEAKSAYQRAASEAGRHLQTDAANGPNWILLALYQAKSGSPQNAYSFIKKAESLGADDMDSQLYKARILEILGKRDEALATLAACFQKGASASQVEHAPDMQALRKDPRYRQMVLSKSAGAAAG